MPVTARPSRAAGSGTEIVATTSTVAHATADGCTSTVASNDTCTLSVPSTTVGVTPRMPQPATSSLLYWTISDCWVGPTPTKTPWSGCWSVVSPSAALETPHAAAIATVPASRRRPSLMVSSLALPRLGRMHTTTAFIKPRMALIAGPGCWSWDEHLRDAELVGHGFALGYHVPFTQSFSPMAFVHDRVTVPLASLIEKVLP